MDRRSPNRRSPGPSRPDPVDRVEDEDEEMPGPSDPEPEAVASPSVPSPIRRPEAPAPSAPSPIRPSVIARAGPARSVIARAGPGPIRRAPVGASSIRRAPAAASRRAPVDDPMAPGPSGIGLRYLEGQPSGYPYGDLYRGFTPPPAPESRRYLNSLNPFGPSNRASPYQQPDAFRTSPYDRPDAFRTSPYDRPDAFRTSPYDRPGPSQPSRAPERESQQRYSMTDMMARMAAPQTLGQRTSSYSNRFRPSPSKASQGSTSQQPSSSGCQGSSCSSQAQLENRPFSSGHQETTWFRNYQRGTLESEPNRPQIQRQAQSLDNSPANPDPAARRRRIVSSMNAEQSNRIMRVPAARPENQLTPKQVQGIRELNPSRRRRSRNNEDDDDDLPGPSRRSRSRSPLSRQASGRTQGTADSLSPGNRSQEDGSPEIFEYEAPAGDDNNDDIDDELEDARQGSSKHSSPASARSSRQLESPKRLSYSYKPDQPISYCNPDPRYMNKGLPSPSEPGPSTRFYPQYDLGPRPAYRSPREPSSSRRSSRSPNPALLTPSQRSRRRSNLDASSSSQQSQQSPRRATPRSRQESPKVPSGHPDDATIARFNATNTHWRRASDSPVRLMCNLPWPADQSPPPVPRDVPSTLLRTRPARLSIPAPSTRNPPPGYFYGRQESDRRYDGSTANRRLSPKPKSKPSDIGRRSDEDDGYSAESESEYEE